MNVPLAGRVSRLPASRRPGREGSHLGTSGGLHDVADAGACDLANPLPDILLAHVDHVGRAQLGGEQEPAGDDVDADDRRRACRASQLRAMTFGTFSSECSTLQAKSPKSYRDEFGAVTYLVLG